ncbi:hypothetical protein V6N11_033076 [Hibiscus sabdariffa]|uniref:Uncharacterized protein n=1 Tax=Hibiscus sabdariffa TaxID=183260 RepID=A0ABR1ZBA6_9ROSI
MFLITSVHGAGRSRMRMLGQLGRWTTLLASLACSLGISSWLYLSHSSSSFDREVEHNELEMIDESEMYVRNGHALEELGE